MVGWTFVAGSTGFAALASTGFRYAAAPASVAAAIAKIIALFLIVLLEPPKFSYNV
jgi:hypothetical protein